MISLLIILYVVVMMVKYYLLHLFHCLDEGTTFQIQDHYLDFQDYIIKKGQTL
jgi:hypothetical protein